MRFNGYTNNLVKIRCSDFLEFFSTNSLSWEQLSYDGDFQYKNLHYGLIHSGAPTLIDCDNYELPGIIDFQLRNFTLCKNGDVVFADASEDTNEICKPVEIINTSNEQVISGLHTIHARDTKDITVTGYKGYLFSSESFHKQVFRLTQGTKIFSINPNNFSEMFVGIPDKDEQLKIVSFLKAIDSRIKAQSKIIDNIESLISGIRYQVFARKNRKFTSSDVRQLGDFLEEYSKKNINNNLISVAVGKYGIRKRDEIYSKELSSDYSKNKVIEKDTLCIGMGSSQIDIGILTEDIRYCVSPAYTTYRITDINSSYLNEYLIYLNKLLSKRYMIIGARQGKSVNKKELLMHELEIHSIDEQLEIVKIFSALKEKLEKEKDILELYKKQKAYLLQNLFI